MQCRIGLRRRLFTAAATDLPDGTFILNGDEPWLIAGGAMRKWTQNGYTDHGPLPTGEVLVLTPAVTVEVISAGYRPQIDVSALGA